MNRLIVDTSAYSALKQGKESAVAALQRASSILIPTVVLGELWAGFEVGARRERNRAELELFLRSPRVKVVAITGETAERYALIYAHLRSARRPIPTNDLWIAAAAMEHGAELLTADSHFLHVPQIMVRFLPSVN
ncbi:MAG: type II toxin-antitoxin system VapC family toxin [Caldilineaceae bacterium]|nr:type II toxin-antitoxin system VapC family toxin [Caldilineaceae bacterium]